MIFKASDRVKMMIKRKLKHWGGGGYNLFYLKGTHVLDLSGD